MFPVQATSDQRTPLPTTQHSGYATGQQSSALTAPTQTGAGAPSPSHTADGTPSATNPTAEQNDLVDDSVVGDDDAAADYDEDTDNEYYAKECREVEVRVKVKAEAEDLPAAGKRSEGKEKAADHHHHHHPPGQSEVFTCDICLRIFFDPDQLVMHTQVHSDHMVHECGQCKARFFQPDTLQRHLDTHSERKKHPCDQCPASYSRVDNLAKHRALKHPGKLKRGGGGGGGAIKRSSRRKDVSTQASSQRQPQSKTFPSEFLYENTEAKAALAVSDARLLLRSTFLEY